MNCVWPRASKNTPQNFPRGLRLAWLPPASAWPEASLGVKVGRPGGPNGAAGGSGTSGGPAAHRGPLAAATRKKPGGPAARHGPLAGGGLPYKGIS